MRRSRVLTAAAVVAISLGTPALPAHAVADPFGQVLNILPPGQSGGINATDLAKVLLGDPQGRVAVDGKNAPKNFANQLEMYDALGRLGPDEIAGADLTKFYKNAGFEPDQVVRQATPKPGVTIRWDSFGVPYIKGATKADVAWGAGYAGTIDRMFLQDVLRHAGAARSAEFLGGTDANIAMDQEQLRTAPYTEQEAADQIATAAGRHGAEGGQLLATADAYIAGINAAQNKLCPLGLPTGLDCPAEYVALGKKPQKWDRADLTYVASLVGGIFGKGGGGEYANALWLQRLRQRFGDAEARRVYDDLRAKNDPEAPATATVAFPYGGSGGIDPDRPGVALPDLDGPTAPGSGATVAGVLPPLDDLLGGGEPPALPVPFELPGLRESSAPPTSSAPAKSPAPAEPSSPAESSAPAESPEPSESSEPPGLLDAPFGPIDLRSHGSGMSNAALVAADRTLSGHPVAVFGPQTGYYAPQLLTEQVLDGPGVKARGVAFAGTNLVVQLGRGVDYAWSATSASGDNVDTVAERLCNLDGSAATVNSTAYLKDGVCTPLDSRVHTETVIPNLTAPGLPQRLKFQVLRTDHGIVQLRTTAAGGTPVAIVLQRSTYQHEVDSIMGFSRVNDPGFVRDAASFQRAVEGIDYTFNWFYADSRDIAYYGSGLLPKRSGDVEFDLPRWGEARFDWQGFLPFEDHAREINPPTGYLVSWNNKQAPGFSAADNSWGYGPVYRSLALSDRIAGELAAGRTVTRESLAGLVEDAATVDSRARHTLPMLLDAVGDGGGDPQVVNAVAVLRDWLADGAHRVDRDRDGSYDHQAAIALFDAWWEDAAKATLRGGLGGALVDALPQGLDDHPRSGIGSAWNGVAWYGYVSKDLRQLLGQPVNGRWHRSYCGDGTLAACRRDLRSSLAVAASGLLQDQAATSVAALTYDKHVDDIRSTVGGVVGVRPIDWQNRPTFQQVVAYTAHRP